MSLLKDKRIQKLLAQQQEEDDLSSSSESDAPIATSSKFAALKKKKAPTSKKEAVKNEPKSKLAKEPEVNSHQATCGAQTEIPDVDPKTAPKEQTVKVASTAKKEKVKADPPAPSKQRLQNRKQSTRTDDDALLNAILEERGEDAEDEDVSSQGKGLLQPPVDDPFAVLTMMTLADIKELDYRNERIKSFGKESVPDVSGDELRRNGIAVPKIRKGPFVTPNLGSGHWHTLGGSGNTVELKVETSETLTNPTAVCSPVPSLSPTPTVGQPKVPKRLVYAVDVHSKGYLKAQAAFDFTVNSSMGDINALFQCWQEHPYHLPMLLQLSQAFHITGDTANTNLFMDLALHVTGMLLSSGGASSSSVATPTSPSGAPLPNISNFTIAKTPRERVLPYQFPANRPVFVALCRGMHSALRQGSAHTAHEMCKVLLSLDEEDPQGAALMLDVTAIRCREWLYLIELHHRLVYQALKGESGEGVSSGAADADAPSAFTGGFQQSTPAPTGLEWVALPSIHFNAALSRFMYASNSSASATSSKISGKGGDKAKGNRSAATQGQRTLVSEGNSGTQTPVGGVPPSPFSHGSSLLGRQKDVHALANAIGLFPKAALCLAEAIEEKLGNDPWMPLTFCYEDVKSSISQGPIGPYVAAASEHLAKLFAVSSKGMWKSTQHAKLLRDAAALAVKEDLVAKFHAKPQPLPSTRTEADSSVPVLLTASFDVAASALGTAVRRLTGTILHDRYIALPEENVTGVFASQIPRELLEAGDEDAPRHFERVTEAEAQLLRRYEAAFGALPDNLRFAERMQEYGRRLEDRVRQMGQDEGAVTMFLRTMLPWNDVNEMALRRAFEEAGVEDPAVVARRLQRQHEWEVMNRADALAPEEDLPPDQL